MKSRESENSGSQRDARSERWKRAKGQHALKRAMLTEDCEELRLEWHRRGSVYTLSIKAADTASVVANSLQAAWEGVQFFRIGFELGRREAKGTAP